MSGLGFTDNIVNDYDELSQLKRDLEEMDDMPTNLNYDNSGLMVCCITYTILCVPEY